MLHQSAAEASLICMQADHMHVVKLSLTCPICMTATSDSPHLMFDVNYVMSDSHQGALLATALHAVGFPCMRRNRSQRLAA